MMFFSERKKLAEEYEKWVSENKDVLDCPLTVISWLVAEGYVGKTKVADLEAKLAESEEKINMLEEHKFYADNIIQAYAEKCKQYEKQIAELTRQHEDKGEPKD